MTRQSSDVLCCMEAIAQHSEAGLEFSRSLGILFWSESTSTARSLCSLENLQTGSSRVLFRDV